MSSPDGSYGAGGDTGGGTLDQGSAPAQSAEFNSGATQGSSQTSSGGSSNGAWDEVLNSLPREFRPILTPHLQKFDSNYGQLAQSYAPFKKSFVDKGVSVEDLTAAHQLYNLVNTNPQLVYERLASALQQNQFAEPQGAQEAETPEESATDEYEDPRMRQMAEQMTQMQQYMQYQYEQQQQAAQQYQQQQLTQQYESQLDAGIKQILATDPSADVQDLLNRVMLQVSQDQEPDMNKAYAEQQAFIQKVRAQPLNGASAPRIMPTNGGMPPTIDNSRPKTEAEKTARVMQLIQAAQQAGAQ